MPNPCQQQRSHLLYELVRGALGGGTRTRDHIQYILVLRIARLLHYITLTLLITLPITRQSPYAYRQPKSEPACAMRCGTATALCAKPNPKERAEPNDRTKAFELSLQHVCRVAPHPATRRFYSDDSPKFCCLCSSLFLAVLNELHQRS